MKKDLRQWLDETLATRPQSVAVPDQSIRNRSLDKVSNELRAAGYRRFGGHGYADPWVFEFPHPAHEARHKFTLYPFSILDRRLQWSDAHGKFVQIGPWLPSYSSLQLFTSLDDPSGMSYCRPSNTNFSPRQIEASHRARYFEDIEVNPIFGELACFGVDEGWGPSYLLIKAASAEIIRGAHPDVKRQLDDGTTYVLRPMKGWWFLQLNGDREKGEGLIHKLGLTEIRSNPKAVDELSPEDRWDLLLSDAWFCAHGQSGTNFSPLDSEEAYARDFLMRPHRSLANVSQRIAQMVAEGPQREQQADYDNSGVAPPRGISAEDVENRAQDEL